MKTFDIKATFPARISIIVLSNVNTIQTCRCTLKIFQRMIYKNKYVEKIHIACDVDAVMTFLYLFFGVM